MCDESLWAWGGPYSILWSQVQGHPQPAGAVVIPLPRHAQPNPFQPRHNPILAQSGGEQTRAEVPAPNPSPPVSAPDLLRQSLNALQDCAAALPAFRHPPGSIPVPALQVPSYPQTFIPVSRPTGTLADLIKGCGN